MVKRGLPAINLGKRELRAFHPDGLAVQDVQASLLGQDRARPGEEDTPKNDRPSDLHRVPARFSESSARQAPFSKSSATQGSTMK